MPVASLRLPASPDQVRTARLVAAAAARRGGVPEELLDEVRLAVGEATARAVLRHTGGRAGAGTVPSADGYVDVTFRDGLGEFTVEVRDGLPAMPGERRPGGDGAGDVRPLDSSDDDLALALIEALPDRVDVGRDDDGEILTLVWLLPAPEVAEDVTTADAGA